MKVKWDKDFRGLFVQKPKSLKKKKGKKKKNKKDNWKIALLAVIGLSITLIVLVSISAIYRLNDQTGEAEKTVTEKVIAPTVEVQKPVEEGGRSWWWYLLGAILLIGLVLLFWQIERRTRFSPIKSIRFLWKWGVLRTLVFVVFCLAVFYIFMTRRHPGFQIGLVNLLDSDWRGIFLFSTVFWLGLVALILAIFVHQKVWSKIFWLWLGAMIVLAILGFRPVGRIDSSQKSYSAFEFLQPDSTLLAEYYKAEPLSVWQNIFATHKDDYQILRTKVKKGDVLVFWARGSICYGPTDLLGREVRAGRSFASPETKRKLRDPSAHPFSPVVGHRSDRLGIISAFRGSPLSPETGEGALFFLLVVAEGKGDILVLPSNVPKSKYYYGKAGDGFSSNLTIKVYHFPRERMANL